MSSAVAPELYSVGWEGEDCIHCHALFALPAAIIDRLRKTHETFYCPYCRGGMSYQAKTAEEKLRAEVAELKRRVEWRDEQIAKANSIAAGERRAAENSERRRRSTRAVVTKLKKRAASGRCPCCSASFPDLKRHIEAQHPCYGEEGS